MRTSTRSTVTITMSGSEATRLAAWLNENGADRLAISASPRVLLEQLREIPDELEEGEG